MRGRETGGGREERRRAGPLPRALRGEAERRLPRRVRQREAFLEVLHAAGRERLERAERLGHALEL